MNDIMLYVVMGLVALLGIMVAFEKPKQDRAASRRYLLLMVVVAALVILGLFGKGVFGLLFGGC